jgi:hypothetical protein
MKRTPELQGFVDAYAKEAFGQTLTDARNFNRCVMCSKAVDPIGTDPAMGGFRDALSAKEYRISGMCQDCQDKIFGEE